MRLTGFISKDKKGAAWRFARNTGWTYAAFIYTTLVGVILLPFIIHYLGKDSYGIFTIAGVVTGYANLLDLGIGISLVKLVAEYNTANEYKKINKIISTAFILYLILGIIGCGVIWGFTDYFVATVFHIPDELTGVAKIVFRIGAITFLFSFVFGVFGNIITGMQRFDVMAKLQIAIRTASAVTIVLILWMGYGLIAFIIIFLLFGILGGIMNIIFAKKLMPQLSILPRFFDFAYVNTIVSFSFAIFIASIAVAIAFNIDKLLIGVLLPIDQVTVYTVGATLAMFVYTVPSKIAPVIIPAASELDTKKEEAAIKELILKGTMIAISLSLPIFIILFTFAHKIVNLWMGHGFEVSASVLQVLAVGFFVNTFGHAITPVLVGVGRMKFYAISSIFYLILNIVLSWILIPKFGVVGASLGTSIAVIVFSLTLVCYGISVFKIGPWDLIKRMVHIKT